MGLHGFLTPPSPSHLTTLRNMMSSVNLIAPKNMAGLLPGHRCASNPGLHVHEKDVPSGARSCLARDPRCGSCLHPTTSYVFGVGSARRSIPSGVAHGFSLIPVSGVGVVVDGEKTGGNWVEGTFNKDMTNDEMTFLDTQRIVKPLSQTCNHIWCAQQEEVLVCAYGEVLSVHAPSRSWQLPLSGRETARKKKI